jgi:hypothetical protein
VVLNQVSNVSLTSWALQKKAKTVSTTGEQEEIPDVNPLNLLNSSSILRS